MVQPLPASLVASLPHPSLIHNRPQKRPSTSRPQTEPLLADNYSLKYLSPSLSGKFLLKCLLLHGALPNLSNQIKFLWPPCFSKA